MTTRLVARVIDAIILFIVNMIVVTTLVVGALFGGSSGFFGGFSLPGLISSVIGAVIYVGYFALLESSRGQTIGKMLMKVQVQGPDGQNPTMEQALKRNAWLALSIIPVIGGLLGLAAAIYIIVTINNNTQTRQGWHDEFAGGTKVIKIG
ncbi:MAG: RDD family protein [Nitriliruptoraceae bacterium]